MNNSFTWKLIFTGRVQGVGLRPFIARVAKTYGVCGETYNEGGTCILQINSIRNICEKIHQEILSNAPPRAHIATSQLEKTDPSPYSTFNITSSRESPAQPFISQDFSLCRDCQQEITNPSNRRYLYPFTTCTQCGPRYSIINRIPYDRMNTNMTNFEMCPHCRTEYGDPQSRRYHSQTNSCHTCGIKLTLFSQNQKIEYTDKVIHDAWRAGQIIAIKGNGGYLLTCDALQVTAISRIRVNKKRPSKPLAVMFSNVYDLEKFLETTDKEKLELQSHTAPITLLPQKQLKMLPEMIAPGLQSIGAMLPNTALLYQLLNKYENPIIATSANITGSPIIYKDDSLVPSIKLLADMILSHDLPINTPQDDSVISITQSSQTKIILRRGRGLAPSTSFNDLELNENKILALGASLKAAFSIQYDQEIYTSQYFGNLYSYDTQQNFSDALSNMTDILRFTPELILIDSHPDTPTLHLIHDFPKSCVRKTVQHHQAHFAAILGEHRLLHADQKILGVIWDGIGMGEDGNMWGGEFFTFHKKRFNRVHHLEYYNYALGDKMAKEPRIAALALTLSFPKIQKRIKEKFSSTEYQILTQRIKNEKRVMTSSMGRLFDAVASLLDIIDIQTYEGEAAILLESAAQTHIEEIGIEFNEYYEISLSKTRSISTDQILKGIIKDIDLGLTKGRIAAKFHRSLVEMIQRVSQDLNINSIALSGGVFQNGLLIDLTHHHLIDKTIYTHQELSPNDENISFGQIIYHHLQEAKVVR